MAHSPGPIRWHCRQAINALIYQAIVDRPALGVGGRVRRAGRGSPPTAPAI
jgi:hypothetical protein